MNTPNKLTMLRIILIPFFVVFLLGNFSAWSQMDGTCYLCYSKSD